MLFWKTATKSSSIVKRVTAWYALLITGLILLVMVLVFGISSQISSHNIKLQLIEEVTEMSHDIDDFESYDDGIFYLLYSQSGELLRGQAPSQFDTGLALKDSDLQSLELGDFSYAYYDIALPRQQGWLRGVSPVSGMSKDMRVFLLTLGIGLPIFLVAVVGGGYLILKRAFSPIGEMITTAREITDRQDYSQRLTTTVKTAELEELAGAFNVMLGSIEASFDREKQFNHDVSHELRTPLSVILAESEFGQTYVTDLDEAKTSYQTINRQGRKMKALIEQILELSRAEHLQVLNSEVLNLSDLVEEQAPAYEVLADQRGVSLTLDLMPQGQLAGDRLLLVRLLDNLVANAIKYAKTEVGISVEEVANQIELTVWDDGIGISEEEQEKVWNRFYQVDSSRTEREDSNSGLGLALVKRIADLHEASIVLKSAPNQGTRVTIGFKM